MNREIAKKWATLLRSGDFTKQKGGLANQDRTKHCVMGVLCEVALRGGVDMEVHPAVGHVGTSISMDFSSFDHSLYVLPTRVKQWAGMASNNGKFGEDQSLLDCNDYLDLNFCTLADIIEENVDTL